MKFSGYICDRCGDHVLIINRVGLQVEEVHLMEGVMNIEKGKPVDLCKKCYDAVVLLTQPPVSVMR